MRHVYLSLTLILLVVLEGVAIGFLPSKLLHSQLIFTPHWVLIFLTVVIVLYNNYELYIFLVYAAVFGLLIDILYTDTLGVYLISYTLATYVALNLIRILQSNFIMSLLISLVTITVAEIIISLIYTVIGVTEMYWLENIQDRLIPTLIANLVIILIIYPITKKVIFKSKKIDYSI